MIAFVSPTRSTGTTTVLLTLARILTREPNAEALLIDLDRQHPSLGTLLESKINYGMQDVLTGEIPMSGAVVPMSPGNLALLPMKDMIAEQEWSTSTEKIPAEKTTTEKIIL